MTLRRFLLLAPFFGVACDSASAPGKTASIGIDCGFHELTVSPAVVTMTVGDSAQLAATKCGPSTGPASAPVFWRSSNAAVATVDSARGKVRAVAPGVMTVIALEVADTAVKAAAVIQVNPR